MNQARIDIGHKNEHGIFYNTPVRTRSLQIEVLVCGRRNAHRSLVARALNDVRGGPLIGEGLLRTIDGGVKRGRIQTNGIRAANADRLRENLNFDGIRIETIPVIGTQVKYGICWNQ